VEIAEDRCPWAIKFGIGLHTRCGLPRGHAEDKHIGPGLEEYGYQELHWFAGDSREYETDRDDQWCWEGP
jgi:hypothetical protein